MTSPIYRTDSIWAHMADLRPPVIRPKIVVGSNHPFRLFCPNRKRPKFYFIFFKNRQDIDNDPKKLPKNLVKGKKLPLRIPHNGSAKVGRYGYSFTVYIYMNLENIYQVGAGTWSNPKPGCNWSGSQFLSEGRRKKLWPLRFWWRKWSLTCPKRLRLGFKICLNWCSGRGRERESLLQISILGPAE